MQAIYGDCCECGFPVLLKDSNPVACPFCAVVNQPVDSLFSISIPTYVWIIGAAVLGSVLLLAVAKK